MQITLSSPTFDPVGYVTVRALPDSQTSDIRRRVNRVATLDTGVAFNDRGFVEGDRDISVRWRSDYDTDEAIRRMMRLYSLLHLTNREGVFLVAPTQFSRRQNESELTVMVVRRLA